MNRNFIRFSTGWYGKLAAAISTVIVSAVAIMAVSSSPATVPSATAAGLPSRQIGLPLYFIPNQGQADREVLYTARMSALTAYFTSREAIFRSQGATVRVSLAGANPSPLVEGQGILEGKANFILGDKPDQWQTGVPLYEAIVYRQAYPGVDLFYRSSERQLKSEFRLAPGADPRLIRLTYSGVAGLRVDDGGVLVLRTAAGEMREQKPDIYQDVDRRRVPVAGCYRLLGANHVGFEIGSYDRTKPLVIDPVLSYSTYLSGSGMDSARAVAADASGNAYVAGYTDSSDFPTRDAVQGRNGGGVDAFVAKLNAAGNALVFCTYLGGSWDDRASGIAVDSGGNVYVTGQTTSPNFPVTSGVRQRALGGGRDAFVVKLNPSGNALVYSTLLGGSSHDSGNGIAIDALGNAYVAGTTYSTNFPVVNGFQSSNQGRQDAFVAKLNGDGSGLLWSTYLGGSGDDQGTAIAVDSAGNAYVTGGTDSTNFPTLNAFQRSVGGGQDAFVAKLSAAGGALIYSTYLGGSGGTVGAGEMGTGIAVDAAGAAYVAGVTSSTNFPIFNALQALPGKGGIDGFVAKVGPSGSSLTYATYLGGSGADYPTGIAVDSSGSAWVTGYTSSTNFPVVNPLQAADAGGYDAFLARLNAQGNALVESTYFGGSGSDAGYAVFVTQSGQAFVAGDTQSTDFPLKNSIPGVVPGGMNAFVLRIGTPIPTAVYRAGDGATVLNAYGSTTRYSASGVVVGDPGASQSSQGDTFAVGRNSGNQVWMNMFRSDTQSWSGWVLAGGTTA